MEEGVKIAVVETRLESIDSDLQEIKKAIRSTSIYLIVTLLSVVVSAATVSFWVGYWRSEVEHSISQLRQELDRHEQDSQRLFNELKK